MKTLEQIFDTFPDLHDGRVPEAQLLEHIRDWYYNEVHPVLEQTKTQRHSHIRVADRDGSTLGFVKPRHTIDRVFQIVLPPSPEVGARFVTLEKCHNFYVLREGDAHALAEQLLKGVD